MRGTTSGQSVKKQFTPVQVWDKDGRKSKAISLMVNMFLEQQSPWLPAEGKKAVTDWIKAYKLGREDFKIAVDDNYKKVEDFFAGADKGKAA